MALNEYLSKLTPVKKGDSIRKVASSERMNAIQASIFALSKGDNVIAGDNLRKKTFTNSVMLSADSGGRGGGAAVDHFPWEISVEEDPPPGSGTWSVHIRPGTISGILPSNMFDTFQIFETGTFYVVLDVTTDGDTPTDASLDVVTFQPAPIGSGENLAPVDFSILLGLVVDKVPFQIINYNFQVFPQETTDTLRTSPVPGEPFYDKNYTWVVQ
jgi:hypothetical protein